MNTQRTLPKRSALAATIAAACLLAACASAPKSTPQLDQARAAYSSASNDASVVAAAPADLRRGQEALQQAEAAQRDGKKPEEVDHYAYLANQRIASAQQAAALSRAEQSVTASSAERDRIVLAARTREADAQRNNADMARRQADDQARAADMARQNAAASNSRANDLQRQLAELNAKQTSKGMVMTLGDVLFDTGRSTLNPGAGRTIDQLATFLKDNPDRTVRIEGYTDNTGSLQLNQNLSQQRAESVKSALLTRGIGGDRINTQGFGPSSPVATNATEAGRQQNRRIEIVISNS
ncbi:MAG: flagellar motor protein MotB [Rhizobacter sp.]|nr:flagellar motor protein MotB [Rhizobacter sp.]